MKYLLLCVVLFSFSFSSLSSLYALGFDESWFQNEICDQTIIKGKKPGFYKYNNAHHFNYLGVDYFVQRTGRDYFVKSKAGSIKLKGEIKRVLDFIIIDGHFWIVGETGLVEFNERGTQVGQYSNFKSARGVYHHPYLDKIYIAAERDGLIIFDFYQKQFEYKFQLTGPGFPGRSQAVSVTGDPRGNIYVAMASLVQGSLNGVAVFNPGEEKIIRYVEFDRAKAGTVDTYASIYYVNGSLFFNNGGWIHEIGRSFLLNSTVVPKWHELTYSAGDIFQYIRFRGDLIFDQGKLYGCSIVREKLPNKSRPIKYGKVFSILL